MPKIEKRVLPHCYTCPIEFASDKEALRGKNFATHDYDNDCDRIPGCFQDDCDALFCYMRHDASYDVSHYHHGLFFVCCLFFVDCCLLFLASCFLFLGCCYDCNENHMVDEDEAVALIRRPPAKLALLAASPADVVCCLLLFVVVWLVGWCSCCSLLFFVVCLFVYCFCVLFDVCCFCCLLRLINHRMHWPLASTNHQTTINKQQ